MLATGLDGRNPHLCRCYVKILGSIARPLVPTRFANSVSVSSCEQSNIIRSSMETAVPLRSYPSLQCTNTTVVSLSSACLIFSPIGMARARSGVYVGHQSKHLMCEGLFASSCSIFHSGVSTFGARGSRCGVHRPPTLMTCVTPRQLSHCSDIRWSFVP